MTDERVFYSLRPIGADKFGTVGGDETTDDEEDDDNTVYECPGPGAVSHLLNSAFLP